MKDLLSRVVLAVLMLALVGCASSRDAEDDESGERERPRDVVETVGPSLAPPVPAVSTIQIYPTSPPRSDIPPEANLPVVGMRGGQQLVLQFDLMEQRGRPLAVYFYHADRNWERRLSPAEFMRGFRRDEILDYQRSHDTETQYTHYTYTFPNENVGFLVSGNYVLRVTEQDNEGQVLFERAFFVAEHETDLDIQLDDRMRPGHSFASVQPAARFLPPSDLGANVFDFGVCFAQNGRYDQARCSDRPRLAEQPHLIFELEPHASFAPQTADFRLDLNDLRGGMDIERSDFSTTPYTITLTPDYARFPDAGLERPLNRQPVISGVRGVGEPSISADYVRVRFSYVPFDEEAYYGDIYVTGSFNDWRLQRENQLSWNAEQGRYEGEALVKQGQHEYTYVTGEGQRLPELQRNVPRRDNEISAFVYYFDMNVSTDRLLAVGSRRSRF